MKIDKRNPLHWLYLLLFGVNVAVAILLRPMLHRRRCGKLLLYGHKRNGNLLAIHDWVLEHRPEDLDMHYLTMDPIYYGELRRQGIPSVLAISPSAVRWLATADAVISDHGLHAMRFMIGATDMKFFDVWHGIPFKGFDAEDFRLQHLYDGVLVASQLLKTIYVNRFGFQRHVVHATGYARTDVLVENRGDPRAMRANAGLPEDRRVVVFAPTWRQDARNRSIYPFGLSEQDFLQALGGVVSRHDAVLVLRTHLNCKEATNHPNEVIAYPSSIWPNTERLLLATDVLICDWSSIAFDFLLLDRPAIFLDVAPPFNKGLSMEGRFRVGDHVASLEGLCRSVELALSDPASYLANYRESMKEARAEVYESYADGTSAKRCVERLREVMKSSS